MEFQNKPDKFWWFVAIGTILMMIEWILRLTYYKQIP
jgi:hypothetical protein